VNSLGSPLRAQTASSPNFAASESISKRGVAGTRRSKAGPAGADQTRSCPFCHGETACADDQWLPGAVREAIPREQERFRYRPHWGMTVHLRGNRGGDAPAAAASSSETATMGRRVMPPPYARRYGRPVQSGRRPATDKPCGVLNGRRKLPLATRAEGERPKTPRLCWSAGERVGPRRKAGASSAPPRCRRAMATRSWEGDCHCARNRWPQAGRPCFPRTGNGDAMAGLYSPASASRADTQTGESTVGSC